MEDERIKASPAIKRIAKQYGIDLSEIAGTGEDGRIEVSDLEEYLLGRKRTLFKTLGIEQPEEEEDSDEAEDDVNINSETERTPYTFNGDVSEISE